jgi:hypothetical protein
MLRITADRVLCSELSGCHLGMRVVRIPYLKPQARGFALVFSNTPHFFMCQVGFACVPCLLLLLHSATWAADDQLSIEAKSQHPHTRTCEQSSIKVVVRFTSLLCLYAVHGVYMLLICCLYAVCMLLQRNSVTFLFLVVVLPWYKAIFVWLWCRDDK